MSIVVRPRQQITEALSQRNARARWKTRGRGPGVWKTRGLVENTGSQWKTRGLSAKHRETVSPNNEVEILLFQIATKNNRRETWS